MFRPALTSPAEKIGHNLKYDLGVLSWQGISVAGPFFDTMLAHTLVEPDQKHQMDFLSEAYLGYTPVSIKSLIGEKDREGGQLNMAEVARESLEKVAEARSTSIAVLTTWSIG